MAIFNEKNAISGKQARATAVINGRQEDLLYAKTLEAKIEKKKADVPILGKTNVASKAAGWSGTGTLTVYYVTSVFRQLAQDYIRTGKDFYFDLQVVNEDPSSDAGNQTVMLRNCNLDSIIATKFDATSDDMMDEELAFTFNDYEIQSSFKNLV